MEHNRLDFSPAKWIWMPSERTLPNTFVCFRKDFTIKDTLVSAKGYIFACSRYVLSVNGQRVQFGPAPCDPRYEEADPVDLLPFLHPGNNTMGVRVLYFGHGDGTWVTGKPGLIYNIALKYQNGIVEYLLSDEETFVKLDESHPAGMYKRWYLRALQEIYDARKDTVGFDTPEFKGKNLFEHALILSGAASNPSIMNGYYDYLYDSHPDEKVEIGIFRREIPMPEETFVSADKLYHAGMVNWKRDPDDWFRFRHPDSFEIQEGLPVTEKDDSFCFIIPESGAVYLTFALPEECCGFIDFSIEAPENTTIEAIVQEGHNKDKTLWLDSQFYSWTRFICRSGTNHFTSFDFECFRFLQLHIRAPEGEKIKIHKVGVLRRFYPTRYRACIHTDDHIIQKVLDAALNTLKNSAIETFVDGMARERQQYSGDGNHQVHAFSYLYGADEPIVSRYYKTWGEGMTHTGFYLDAWPAYDRLNRIAQRELGLTPWGSILDHGVQFCMSCCAHFYEVGNPEALVDYLDNFQKQADYLLSLRDTLGLIPTEDLGTACVWLDHNAFILEKDGKKKVMNRDKRCPFNLYVAAMLRDYLSPVLHYFGRDSDATRYEIESENIVCKVLANYYDSDSDLLIDNLPFAEEDGGKFVSDRSLAISILFGMLPNGYDNSLRALAERPPFVRKSYPANEIWRYKALAKYGKTDCITEDLRIRWANMLSVNENNTLQENYNSVTDSKAELSHCPLAPILSVYEYWTGLKCESRGFHQFSLNPYFGGLPTLIFTLRTASGALHFEYFDYKLVVEFPKTMEGKINLEEGFFPVKSGCTYLVPVERR